MSDLRAQASVPADGVPLTRADEAAAVVSRANHDIRSPLSVITGVLELLESADGLQASEQRYLQLGRRAAEELRRIADAMRLYSALRRNTLHLVSSDLDLVALATETLTPALALRGVGIDTAPMPATRRVKADPAYLRLALTGLAQHFAARLQDHNPLQLRAVNDGDWVELLVQPEAAAASRKLSRGGSTAANQEPELDLLNAIDLIELMGGAVEMAAPSFVLRLPAATAQGH